ncbi:MAG: endonuclease/exonuclease/phosphatase family protein [Candidatus Kariarchaeaceae archaeon]|jgi:endonuclease/exonuclease/phosphatase family metal-dependent hydrolase
MNKETKIYGGLLLGLLLITVISTLSYDLLGQPDDPEDSVTSVRIMTYNIHLTYDYGAGGQYNLQKLKDLIEDNNADIIGLQESEGNRLISSNQNAIMWLAHQLGMYYYYGAPTSDGIWGVSLLSRWEIEDPSIEKLSSEDALQRIAVVAKIKVPQPFGTLDVIVTHLDFQEKETQIKQTEEVIALTSSMDRIVIMGDFNTVIGQYKEDKTLEEDDTYQLLNDTFVDAWVVAGGPFDENTSFYFEEAFEPEDDEFELSNTRIDYIWLKGSLSPLNNDESPLVLGDKDTSDHRAILIEITTS